LIKHYDTNVTLIFDKNKELEYLKLEYYLSQPRLQRFLTATGNSRAKAQRLYRVNLRVSQAF